MKKNNQVAVSVSNIHKEFILPQSKNSTFKQTVVNIVKKNNKITQKVLDGVSFDIKKGEFFGIIGRNGSGKSTLLKILAGVYSPNTGAVYVNGSLTPFIELGVGFNPELSGRDNVFLNGALLGFNRKEMQSMYDDIVKFAELEQFMDQKLKNYSSGMQVRLAFSVAIRAKSDILLIDEVLAVGDVNFQKKCVETFDDLKAQGRTIIFVTHSMGYVREFCDQVAVIDSGKLIYKGEPEEAIDVYNKLNFDEENIRLSVENEENKKNIKRFGDGRATIMSYSIFNKDNKETIGLTSSDKFTVEMEILFNSEILNPAIGIMFRKDPSDNLFGINSLYNGSVFGVKNKGDKIKIRASGIMPLAPGSYYVSFSVSDARSAGDYVELDNLNNIMRIDVDGKMSWGLLSAKIDMKEIK